MTRRTLLSAEQRTRLFGIPSEAAEMAKHYTLSAEDLALVRTKRREIAESVISGRKSGAEMARLYNISPPTVSRIVAAHRAGPPSVRF